jgi:hypothetical protein
LETLSQEAWDILHTKSNAIGNNNQGILDILSKVGLVSKDDIKFLSPDSIQQISNLLKIISNKKFMTNMSKIKAINLK